MMTVFSVCRARRMASDGHGVIPVDWLAMPAMCAVMHYRHPCIRPHGMNQPETSEAKSARATDVLRKGYTRPDERLYSLLGWPTLITAIDATSALHAIVMDSCQMLLPWSDATSSTSARPRRSPAPSCHLPQVSFAQLRVCTTDLRVG